MQETPSPVARERGAVEARRSGYRLRGFAGGAEVILTLAEGLNRVGSAADNDLILGDEGVSRDHALLVVEPGRIELIDQGSKNGTFVDGRRVRRAVLEPGVSISFGSLRLDLEAVDPDDALLALRLTPAPTEARPATSRSTTSVVPGHSGRSAQWLAFATELLETLRSSDAAAGQALALLCSRFGIGGASLCSFGTDGVEVRAAFGDIEETLLEQVRRAWLLSLGQPGEGSRAYFASRPDATAYIGAGSRRRSLGLILTGSYPRHEESRQLLRFLLSLLRAEQDSRPSRRAPVSRSPLVFPPDYVRGRSQACRQLHRHMGHLAGQEIPVLIVGETGVGKELTARILHQSSPRRQRPLVAINCAAVPSQLLEAELFGIGDRVATGVAGRRGRFQEADGGSLFLDEIGEMPAELQAKLLRVLQERKVEPLGAPAAEIDVRLLAATNTDIQAMLAQGTFRRDLFFRLAGDVLRVPPLRRRKEDIPLFVERLMRVHSRATGKRVQGITVRALRKLMDHDWPGNVRELEHQIHRLVCLCPVNSPIDSTLVSLGDDAGEPAAEDRSAGSEPEPASHTAGTPAHDLRSAADLDLATVEREVICEALRREAGNQVRAARLLGISRYRLRRRMEKYRISVEELL